MPLFPNHIADLRRSGLSDGQIRCCEFYSLSDNAKIAKILKWEAYYGNLGNVLCIPYHKADGTPNGYCRLRPDKPRTDPAGKTCKYEAPKGVPLRAYFPPGTVAALADVSKSLILGLAITNGFEFTSVSR